MWHAAGGVACVGLAQHSQPDEGDVPACMVGDGAPAGAGRHALPVHAHAVLPGRAVAQDGAAVCGCAAVLPADGADAGALASSPVDARGVMLQGYMQ